ncbi:MAG: glutamate racemase [Thermoanaerobacteraceae bacterium]|nr:glutamate racemase [Thermoanaerobacteraceae bacterium]
MDTRPIGIYDSGVGGLTVLRECMRVLPDEDYIYFADTGRLPYGEKKREEIIGFSHDIVSFLKEKNVKAVVVACNTSASCINPMDFDIPMVDVLSMGVKNAVRVTRNRRIGVLATSLTVKNHTYRERIKAYDSSMEVYEVAAPEFVSLVESGMAKSSEAKAAVKRYISEFKDTGIDTLVLGCTHYPFLLEHIKEEAGEGVIIVDPAQGTAHGLKEVLNGLELLNENDDCDVTFYASGSTDNLTEMGRYLLRHDITIIKHYW